MIRVALRLARRELWRRPGRTALVAILVAVPVTGLALIDVRYRTGLDTTDDWIVQSYGQADAVISLSQGQPHCVVNCVTREEVETALPTGSGIAWSTEANVPLGPADGGSLVLVNVVAQDASDPLLQGTVRLESGAWPMASNEVAMSRDLMSDLEVRMGDVVRLRHQTTQFRVVGVLHAEHTMLAPGFDFDVLRPGIAWVTGFVDLPGDTRPNESIGTLLLDIRVDRTDFTGSEQDESGRVLVLGWLGGVLAMSVLGVVVAAAFAVSGRRQLVTIGQLSAAGTDPRTIERALALQGTVTGLIGAAIGMAAAVLVHWGWPWIAVDPNEASHAVVMYADMAVIVLTAIGVATVAAIAPTRALARVSVLAALAGRRPVAPVSARQVRTGALMFGGGLLMTTVATTAGVNGGGTEAGMLIAVGLLVAVIGVCLLSPALVQVLAGWAAQSGGSRRIAARSVARHRSRAAAVFASLLMVGMATTGAAVVVEYQADRADATDNEDSPLRLDLIRIRAWESHIDRSGEWLQEPIAIPDLQAAQATVDELVAGSITWTSAASARETGLDGDPYATGEQPLDFLVVDDQLLQLLGVPADVRATVLDSQTGMWLSPFDVFGGDLGLSVLQVAEMTVEVGPVISREGAAAAGMTLVEDAHWFGLADHDLTYDEGIAVLRAAQYGPVDNEERYYVDAADSWVQTNVEPTAIVSQALSRLEPAVARSIVLGSSLLLVILVVAMGMALWAVEGRDERDILVAVGASPATLAKVAAWRAGGLTLAAMVLAVPAGIGIAWMISDAAGGHISVPWLLCAALLVPMPLVIGLGAWASSLVAQQIRPIRASLLAAD